MHLSYLNDSWIVLDDDDHDPCCKQFHWHLSPRYRKKGKIIDRGKIRSGNGCQKTASI